ncbi:hypothetical protein BDA99DRAFT_499746 [Phascolomyces articulosus]|uniref:Uncharacterized protein n=1 Tax=Phascolomyces articulosus TaxID=60185 RepID=A0AAD5KIW7_9FUNG|nr:hypothetical protein BDA99DRAFT_499746 [Phascolomyces articulosus]
MGSIDGTTSTSNNDSHRKRSNTRPQSTATLPVAGRNNGKPPRMVDKELQRLKSLAVVSGLNKAFSHEPQPITLSATTTNHNGPQPSSSSVSSVTSSTTTGPPRPSTVCGLSDFRQPQQTQSTIISSTLSQRSSGSSLHFDYMQYKKQMKRRSNTLPLSAQQQPQQQPSVQRSKAAVLDDLEKDLLGMFEEVYLRNTHPRHTGAAAHSVATQEVDADRIDNWVVSVLPSFSTNPNPEDDDLPTPHDENNNTTTTLLSPPTDESPSQPPQQQHVKELEATVKRLHQAQEQHTQWEESIQKVVATYMEEKEKEADKARQLSQVVIQQERLIEEMQHHLDQVVAANANLRSSFQEKNASWGPALDAARDELKGIQTEISTLAETKRDLQETITHLNIQLRHHEKQLDQSLNTSHQLSSECQLHGQKIDEKLESLKRQLLEKDTLVQKYRIYGHGPSKQQQQKMDQDTKKLTEEVASTPLTNNNNNKRGSKDIETRRSSYASISSIPKPPARSSRRSSANTTTSSVRRSYIARWTGGFLPPAAPPPTDPLPPIPIEMDKQRGASNDSSSLSHPDSPTSLSSSTLLPNHYDIQNNTTMNKGGRPSIDSTAATSVDEEEAYREFAEQLQARLSVSKEIDELQVWQPHDLDELQKRIDAKWGDLQEDDPKRHSLATLASKDGAAFWRGMKKKLRV